MIHKPEHPSNAPGPEIRLGDYILLRDTAGQDPYLSAHKRNAPVLAIPGRGHATPFRVERVTYLSATATEQGTGGRIQLGSSNLLPCEKLEWTNNGAFGLPSPTRRTAEQRAYAFMKFDETKASGVKAKVERCALESAVAATIAGLVSKGAAALPTFKAKFAECAARENIRSDIQSTIGLEVKSECMW
jgi:hypothetical protein